MISVDGTIITRLEFDTLNPVSMASGLTLDIISRVPDGVTNVLTDILESIDGVERLREPRVGKGPGVESGGNDIFNAENSAARMSSEISSVMLVISCESFSRGRVSCSLVFHATAEARNWARTETFSLVMDGPVVGFNRSYGFEACLGRFDDIVRGNELG